MDQAPAPKARRPAARGFEPDLHILVTGAASHHHSCWVDRRTSLDRGIRGSCGSADVLCDQAQRSGGRSPLCRAPRGRETRCLGADSRPFAHLDRKSPVRGMPGRPERMNMGEPVPPFSPASAAPVFCGNQEAGASFLAERRRKRAVRSASRRSGRVAEGGALLRRYGGECLHRGFESLLLRFTPLRSRGRSEPSAPNLRSYSFERSERWQSGRMRRSRKPLRVVRLVEGSNPSLSAPHVRSPCRQAGSGEPRLIIGDGPG
jgi:hypothetical protein